MHKRRLLLPIVLAALIAPMLPSLVLAATMVVNRGLPTDPAHLNTVFPNDGNVGWSQGQTYVTGDSFTVGSPGTRYRITSIRTWSTAGLDATSSVQLGDIFTNERLYFGTGAVAVVASGLLANNSNVSSNPNITNTKVTYSNGAGYLRGDLVTYGQLWQHDFNNLNLVVDGGTTYYFGVDGNPRNPADNWFNHASNAAYSGSPQQGSNDLYNAWAKSDLSTVLDCNSSGGAPVPPCDGGYDRGTDINVQVFADTIITGTTGVGNRPGPCAAGEYQSTRPSDITWDASHTHLWCNVRSNVAAPNPVGVVVGDTCWYGNTRMRVIQFTQYVNSTALLQCD
jgi:hypothetical protein